VDHVRRVIATLISTVITTVRKRIPGSITTSTPEPCKRHAGIADAKNQGMPKRDEIPKSYDEIAHDTVPAFGVFGATPAPASVAEYELEARVRAALGTDARLAQAKIDVLVRDTEVWLSGTAMGPGTIAYAADIARSIEGVTEVHNELTIAF
jgi:hypothetical protein